MNIRLATEQDRSDIERVYMSTFPKDENVVVAKLAIDLLSDNTAIQTLSLVAEADGSVVGHVAFSPVMLDSKKSCLAYILAPLAVQSDYQKRGIGSEITEYGLQQLLAKGVNVVFVYGDPNYYGRFGFNTEVARNYTVPYRLQYPSGWQAVTLNEYALENAPAVINCVTALCDPKLW